MNTSFRRAAVGIPGFCAFLNLYGPQSLLPSLAREFDASPAQISLTMTATTFAIAHVGAVRGRDRRRARPQTRDRGGDDRC